jgi:hypothetical protein
LVAFELMSGNSYLFTKILGINSEERSRSFKLDDISFSATRDIENFVKKDTICVAKDYKTDTQALGKHKVDVVVPIVGG